jgi:4-deoxy-L-threo-5-hexosulose-uronate ketol-isomerase
VKTNFEIRFSSHPNDVKFYDTQRLRKEFLVDNIFQHDTVNWIYSNYDRYMIGGINPVNEVLELQTIDPLKANYFLDRRELGIINIGGKTIVTIDGVDFEINKKEALYIGQGNKSVIFKSSNSSDPGKLYVNSAPAHVSYPTKKIGLAEADALEMGTLQTSNHRRINRLIVNSIVKTCQLQMGLTEFQPGCVWNTMPPHSHIRRMEVYFYFEIPDNQAVCHFMGQTDETRHIWVLNEQAVISPSWSIHAGVGTARYAFIWGMAGENLDYGDMDVCQPSDLR